MKQIALDFGLAALPTLANFHVGQNEAVLHHLQAWLACIVDGGSSLPPNPPMPTYLWGPGGSGKSHLLKAVREALREHGAATGWMDASVHNPPAFNAAWAAVLLDDVHLFTEHQQHTAFNWFVNAQTHWCPVLAAGVFAPVDLPLRDDVRTRLGWGHIFHLHPLPEAQQRMVLREAADARGISMGDEVIDFILTRFSRDLSSLTELLDRLDAYALQTHRSNITIPLIKSMMENP